MLAHIVGVEREWPMPPTPAEIQAICRDPDKIAALLERQPDLSRVIVLGFHLDLMIETVNQCARRDRRYMLEALHGERDRIFPSEAISRRRPRG